ncbi:MAG TPA: hypothetical protein VFV23_01650 [Verrucomicrobiae bacterium]|nr:hypothetical protein [Verrucomicrobiae bacterium]
MKNFKSILLLILVFLAGIAVGIVGTRIVVRRMVEQAILQPGKVQSLAEARLTRKLNLNPQQREKLHGIFQDMHGELKGLRHEYEPQAIKILSRANDQINAMLTPEQQALYEQWKREDHPLLRAIKQSQ